MCQMPDWFKAESGSKFLTSCSAGVGGCPWSWPRQRVRMVTSLHSTVLAACTEGSRAALETVGDGAFRKIRVSGRRQNFQ